MKSTTSRGFWLHYRRLPKQVQEVARSKYEIWKADPHHPSLQFKQIRDDLWSVRINLNYRALCLREENTIAWIWIGKHAEYDQIIG